MSKNLERPFEKVEFTFFRIFLMVRISGLREFILKLLFPDKVQVLLSDILIGLFIQIN